MVGRERIELSTNGLKGRCSTVELPAYWPSICLPVMVTMSFL